MQVQAVYLDDQLSGTIITDNLFENCMTGVVLGGGRDNLVMFNHFVDTDLAVHLDNRGMNWQQQVVARASSTARSTSLLQMSILVTGIGDRRTATTLPALWCSSCCQSTSPSHRTAPPTPNTNTIFAY